MYFFSKDTLNIWVHGSSNQTRMFLNTTEININELVSRTTMGMLCYTLHKTNTVQFKTNSLHCIHAAKRHMFMQR